MKDGNFIISVATEFSRSAAKTAFPIKILDDRTFGSNIPESESSADSGRIESL
jgi:hypothetical protein